MKLKSLCCIFFMALQVSFLQAQSFLKNENIKTTVFFSQNDINGKFSFIKGKVLLYSARKDLEKGDLMENVEDKTAASIRLFNYEGINVGDTLYVINDQNLVVAKLQVASMYVSKSFGHMLIGNGNFKLASINDRVVQLKDDAYSKTGVIYKTKGDYYLNLGETGKAISEYKKALKKDKGNPEAHLELGYIYFKQGLYQFASKEFMEAYTRIARVYDKWDRFRLLKGLVGVKYKEIYESYAPQELKSKYLAEGIQFCKEALKLYDDSIDINYYLGVFYYNNPAPSDEKAKDNLLKVTDINPDHEKAVKANIILARLYLKHKNPEKARTFAMKALKTEPFNENARNLIKIIDNSTIPGIIK